jgi:hypothetical protein
MFIFFKWDWGLNAGFYTCKAGSLSLKSLLQSICPGNFGDGVLWTICLSWPWTMILPISASEVARITCMSHQCLARNSHF